MQAQQTEYKIESKVPMPATRNGRNMKYPFGEMKMGDSFFAAGPENAHKVRLAAYSYAHHHGVKFTARLENGGIRIWRVK